MPKPFSQAVVDALRDGPLSESQLIDLLDVDSTRVHMEVFGTQIRKMAQQKTIQFKDNLYSLYPLEDDDEAEDGGDTAVAVRRRECPTKARTTLATIVEKLSAPTPEPIREDADVTNDIGIFKINHILTVKDAHGKIHRIEMDSESMLRLSTSLSALTNSPYFENFL